MEGGRRADEKKSVSSRIHKCECQENDEQGDREGFTETKPCGPRLTVNRADEPDLSRVDVRLGRKPLPEEARRYTKSALCPRHDTPELPVDSLSPELTESRSGLNCPLTTRLSMSALPLWRSS